MYKRLTAVILLLSFCIVLSLGSYILIKTVSEDILNDLSAFLEYAENEEREKAISTIINCNEKLSKYEKIYAVFLDHSLFENLMVTIPSIEYLYKTDNPDEAMDKCVESIETLKIVVHEQKIGVENIL